jgi:hypothetical protein
MIAELKGVNGKILVYEDGLIISRASFVGFMTQGGYTGERKFFFQDITAIEYKKPTFYANGYIKIVIPGTKDTDATVGFLGSSLSSAKDQNTVILRAWQSKTGVETDRIYNIIMQKLAEKKNTVAASIQEHEQSKVDELKKLGDLWMSGILTEEEFQREKTKILDQN